MIDGETKEKSGWSVVNTDGLRNPPAWAAATVYVAAFIGSILLVAFIILPTLIRVGLLISFGEPDSDDLRSALIGVGAIVTAPFLIWRIWTSHVSAVAAQRQSFVAVQELANSTFSESIEKLGSNRSKSNDDNSEHSPNVEVRLGAIFTLTELARSEDRFKFPVIETLVAYIRFNTKLGSAAPADLLIDTSYTRTEVADRIEAWLNNEVPSSEHLTSALYALSLLSRYSLQDQMIDLGRLNLRKTEVRRLNLYRVILDHSQMEGTTFWHLSLEDSQMQNLEAISSRFWRARFSRSFLKKSNLQFSSLELSTWRECRIIDCNLSYASLADADLRGAIVSACNFQHSFCLKTDFSNSRVDFSDFTDAELSEAKFDYAEIRSVKFSRLSRFGVPHRAAGVKDTSWKDAWIEDSDLSGLVDMTQSALNAVFFADSAVRIPDHLERPPHWPSQSLPSDSLSSLRKKWELRCQYSYDGPGRWSFLDDAGSSD